MCRSYGSTQVLRDVDLAIAAGSIATLTGRSGSGKSTLFKILSGLDRPTSGEVVIDAVPLSQLDDAAASDVRLRHVGLVFQSFNLLPDLTALENVRLPLDIAGVARKEAQARALELLQLLDMTARADSLPHRLSGGEAQRVAVARAMANSPRIVLADEPTGNLDAANAHNVLDAFADINRKTGTAVLIITHDNLAVQRFGEGYHIEDGRLVKRSAQGGPAMSPEGGTRPLQG